MISSNLVVIFFCIAAGFIRNPSIRKKVLLPLS